MKNKSIFIFSALLTFALLLSACGQNNANEEVVVNEPAVEANVEEVVAEVPAWEGPASALVSIPVDAAPEVDGVVDAIWVDAEEIVVEVTDGANMGETMVAIKSVYTDEMIYFYVTYEDPTFS